MPNTQLGTIYTSAISPEQVWKILLGVRVSGHQKRSKNNHVALPYPNRQIAGNKTLRVKYCCFPSPVRNISDFIILPNIGVRNNHQFRNASYKSQLACDCLLESCCKTPGGRKYTAKLLRKFSRLQKKKKTSAHQLPEENRGNICK